MNFKNNRGMSLDSSAAAAETLSPNVKFH